MSSESKLLAVLPAAVREVLAAYAASVRQVLGSQASSLAVLGSAAAGTFVAGKHRIASALVVEAIDLDRLHELARALPRLGRTAVAPSLVFTPDYLRASLDTFPLELLEMQQQHLMVFGDDCFQPLEFESRFIRLQCEREWKSMMLAVRQAVLMAGGDDRRVFDQHIYAADGLLRVLRGMLWLKGAREARPAAQVITEIEALVARPLVGIRALLHSTRPRGWPEFRALHADLDALGSTANAW